MKGERMAVLVFTIIVIQTSLAVEMDIFAGPFVHRRDQKIKNERPIIGVLTQETDGNVTIFGNQLVAATYVKFIESAGGRMVPIFINLTAQQVEKLFGSINGAIFPGGHRLLHHTNYTRVGKQILELARKAYDNNDVFPIWGECLGLELVSMLVAGRDLQVGQLDSGFFTNVDAKNISLTLNLLTDYKTTSLWKSAPSHVVNFLQNKRVAYNNHLKAITPQTYHKNKLLKNFFRIVSTSKDRKGIEFISTMEGRRYPVYLFHWHPAKSQFEWRRDLDINHSFRAVLTGQYFANFFVREAQKSDHQFSNVKEERAALIFNYKPTDVQDYLPFVQAYFF
ncbi:gamma-glutamyl hydrolase-like [Orbicella faveolata]|uniref:gamma-glutamyl hydrolase-like n=1 Tax=Orbicella faveolata TaxID=48498 RepID=UPI0009E28BB0|nr:gamma-glutamyl hydrolase-like [Orbicella faveolata]